MTDAYYPNTLTKKSDRATLSLGDRMTVDDGGVAAADMFFCGEPTADFDTAGEYLRVWYDANCPELHLGGWREALGRWVRDVFFGFRDYVLDRDRHTLMLGLINEVGRIERERERQVALLPTRDVA